MSQDNNVFRAPWLVREKQRTEQANAARAVKAAKAAAAAQAIRDIPRRKLQFEAEEGERRAEARDRAAALAIQRAPARQRIQAKEQRDALFQGTPPEAVWGQKADQLCEDFIEFMAEVGFRGCTILTYGPAFLNPDPNIPIMIQKSMRGFGVATVVSGADTYTSLPYNVFLCEDERLRLYTSTPIQAGRGQAIPGPKTSWKIPQATRERSLYGHNPYILADLPVNHEGYPIAPSPGQFSYQNGKDYALNVFTPMSLEDILHSHASRV